MKPKKIYNKKRGPEKIIQIAIVKKLRLLGWFVKETHGNLYQSGFPDLYACHKEYGPRWVEVKNPKKYRFTPAQLRDFPLFTANGADIWVLVSDSDYEINKLFKSANWYQYLK